MGTLRFRSKSLSALSIVLVLASALGGWHAPDDSDEPVASAVHDHADHKARSADPAPSAAPDHCVFCHWFRALGNGAPVATPLFAAAPIQFVATGELDGAVRTTSRLALPSRAPPLA